MKEIVHAPQRRNGKIALLHITLSGGLLRVLKADKRAIITAASKAQQATDYLVRCSEAKAEVAA